MISLHQRWTRVKAKLAPPPEPPPLPPVDIIDLWRQAIGSDPDPWQEIVLQSDNPRIILNCARQSGKSSVVALKGLHGALHEPKSLTLLVSRSLRQSGELARKVFDAYEATGRKVSPESQSKLALELSNGSRILALPGGDEGSIRGFSGVNRLIIDEASRCSDELFVALRPAVGVSHGAMMLLSTPFGQRGFFFETWEHGQGWLKVEVPAEQCPRLSQEFLAGELRELGPKWYAQEYGCSFLSTETMLLTYELVQRAISADLQPLFDQEDIA